MEYIEVTWHCESVTSDVAAEDPGETTALLDGRGGEGRGVRGGAEGLPQGERRIKFSGIEQRYRGLPYMMSAQKGVSKSYTKFEDKQ